MNEAQIHLALNHVSLFFSLLGGIILLLGFFTKNESYKTLSLYLLIAAAILTAPVYLTGEGAEEIVEKIPGVNESTIKAHEEMAETALVVIIITGVLALGSLIFKQKANIGKYFALGTIILAFASFGTMAQTAHLGGLIRHPELSGNTATNVQENNNAYGVQENDTTATVEKAVKESKQKDDDND